MATVISISSADWGSRALQPGLSDSALARRGKWPEWTQPDDIITGDWTDAAISVAGATAEKSQIAEWFPHTTVFIVLWSPSVYNLLHLFVLHLPPRPSVSSIHRTRYNKLEQCWNNKDILTLFNYFVCFQLAIRCVIWTLGSELEGKKVLSLHLVADVCEENVPHNRGLYGTLVLARSQRCPYRAAKNTGFFFFFAASRSVLALWASVKGCSELGTRRLKMRRWILAEGLKDFRKADGGTETNNAAQLNINSCWWRERFLSSRPRWYVQITRVAPKKQNPHVVIHEMPSSPLATHRRTHSKFPALHTGAHLQACWAWNTAFQSQVACS